MARQRSDWRDDPELARLSLLSLLGLVSPARSWRDETPEAAERREARGEPRPVQPFLDVRIQLWQRELVRMVASVEERPRLRHWKDLDKDQRGVHLPMVHCRECGSMGWTTLVQRDKPHELRTEVSNFYPAFFKNDSRVQFLYPRAAMPPDDPDWRKYEPFWVDIENLVKVEPENVPEGSAIELVRAHNLRSTPEGLELTRDCPFCKARDSLTLIGFRAATLTSLYIDQVFASPFNDDKKLLTFSDSVQDAAHRAGFFGARTWRTNLRVAMYRAIHEREGLTLAELADALGETWKTRMDRSTWISTFLAPNMDWLRDWETLKESGSVPADSNLDGLISWRLAYEVCSEFGLQAGIGRSLPRTGTATVALDGDRLDRAVELLLEPMRNEVPGLREVTPVEVRRFIVGMLHYLRTRGGILARSLPTPYVETCGKDTFVFKRTTALPVYSKTSRFPAFLTDRSQSPRFETWGGKTDSSWYSRWVPTCFIRPGAALTADAASTYPLVLPLLVKAGLLAEKLGKKGENIWGLAEEALVVSPRVVAVACSRCRHRAYIAEHERETWLGLPCLTARCMGSYEDDSRPARDYFGHLYTSGDLQRIFTGEHTGLLDRRERERVESEFKARSDSEDGRRPWFTNLLSCTPTLEMGIDIGDLSAAVLCSVPPGQASFLQRIGRAGRQDGNAFVLTVATSKNHDLYFFAEPMEMMEGEVTPPGVFLDAPAVLERQLAAFCVDRWGSAREQTVAGDRVDLPPRLRAIFAHLDDEGSRHFPFNFMAFVKAAEPALLREFQEMFADAISAETAAHLRHFLVGTDDGKAGLRWRVLDVLRREHKQRESLSTKARGLREELKQLREKKAKALGDDELIDDLESEKDALLALVTGINDRQTLEFLTDQGLLPNYAFPEAAVRLNSVIWRRKKKTDTRKGGRYETLSYEYKRSPSSALSELAPNAEFYAGGRHVKIDQVDVVVSEVETWRFCIECNHSRCIDTGDESKSCPACNNATWCDDGQKFRLLKLQQVFASTRDRDSRIRDDSDDRRSSFYQRQMLVDVKEEERAGAWRVDDANLPFGFEFLRRATFRDVNFGEPTDQGAKSTIAGREGIRPGFEICARCGKVQAPNANPVHALACPSKKDGALPQMESCLYLYREFSSEALRLLLPMTGMGPGRQLNSFVAAFRVGLEEYFGGGVDHLQATVYSDPVEGSALRKQYLVIFDAVPGGTGYLKQLVTPRSEGGEMPLFSALEKALQRIEGCECWEDPDRDGCYRCIYAYRNSSDMEDMSSKAASEIVHRVLALRSKLKSIGSLGEISISGLMDSVLEVRFLEALRRIEKDGRGAKLKGAIVNQKSGYRFSLDGAEWMIEPQVNPPAAESGGVPVSIDFVMRPASARMKRRLAIFLDGWTFHHNRVGQDLRQRMAMLASGGWDVWTFTWADLEEKLSDMPRQDVLDLAVPDPGKLKTTFQKMGLAGSEHLAGQSVFQWFEQELLGDGLAWRGLAKGVLAARMKPALVADALRWKRFVEQTAPPAARRRLGEIMPLLFAADPAESNLFFELMTVHDGTEPSLVATLDDREENLESPEYKAAWHGYLRFFQFLRLAPNAWFMTHLGTQEGEKYDPIAARVYGAPEDTAWHEVDEIEPSYQALARQLMAAGVREPEVGMEIPASRGGTWAEAEMLWEEERVAVTAKADTVDALGEPAGDWTVLFLEDVGEDPQPVVEALAR